VIQERVRGGIANRSAIREGRGWTVGERKENSLGLRRESISFKSGAVGGQLFGDKREWKLLLMRP